jgi:ABC-type polysaccharide/polyol phosphate transport system ATPase subunit
VEGRGSPTRDRNRSRMRNMFKKDEKSATRWQPLITMANIYKIATFNVTGISSGMRMRVLEEFLQKQEIDILLVQEVTYNEFDMIREVKT